jgi:DHA2 family multidrug resistance protein
VAPGLVAATVVAVWVRIDTPDWKSLWRTDLVSLALAIVFLTALEVTLKEAPHLGWTSPFALALSGLTTASGIGLAQRCRTVAEPLIEIDLFMNRDFAIGAWFSFVLGMALFGDTYLMPLFLALVRDHGPLEIGTIMIATGATQLLTAPVATVLERRTAAKMLTAVGYGLFAVGLVLNGTATPAWDFRELFAPQVLRGAALLLCLLPTTRLALAHLPPARVAQGSSMFNLMRNIGGAVGLAVIDTIIELRPARHMNQLIAKLQAGDRATAAFVGLPLERFAGKPLGPIDEATRQTVEPLVKSAAATMSFNEAWQALGALVALSLVALVFLTRDRPAPRSQPSTGF